MERWEIGDIASKIGQLYYNYYLRTSEIRFLHESYVFYEAIRSRSYFAQSATDPNLAIKQLRYFARFIIICLLLNRREVSSSKAVPVMYSSAAVTGEAILCVCTMSRYQSTLGTLLSHYYAEASPEDLSKCSMHLPSLEFLIIKDVWAIYLCNLTVQAVQILTAAECGYVSACAGGVAASAGIPGPNKQLHP